MLYSLFGVVVVYILTRRVCENTKPSTHLWHLGLRNILPALERCSGSAAIPPFSVFQKDPNKQDLHIHHNAAKLQGVFLQTVRTTLFAICSMWFRSWLIEHKCWFRSGSLKDSSVLILLVNLMLAWMSYKFFLMSPWLASNVFLIGRSISANLTGAVHFNCCRPLKCTPKWQTFNYGKLPSLPVVLVT